MDRQQPPVLIVGGQHDHHGAVFYLVADHHGAVFCFVADHHGAVFYLFVGHHGCVIIKESFPAHFLME